MIEEVAIKSENLSKVYKLYDQPVDRLKESVNFFGKKLHKEFFALQDVSFEIKKGETVGIIGKNGSGKSTLLKLVTSVLTPSAGNVIVNGKISALLELGAGFNPELTGLENIYFNGTLMGYSKNEIDSNLDKILAFADIGTFINQSVKSYSSGMFIRLAFSVATIVNPEILIVDEALSVGDIFFQQKCFRRLRELKEQGTSIMLVTHSMADILQFCDWAMLLQNGRIFFKGSADEAVKHYYFHEQGQKSELLQQVQKPGVFADNQSEFYRYEFWPSEEAFLDLCKATVVSNGLACCTGLAICCDKGQPARVFEQGERIFFYYEFELLDEIEVPIGGIVIKNHRDVLVHGKGTLEYGSDVPSSVSKGCRLRFKQTIQLNIAPGEYTFEIALSSMRRSDYALRSVLPFAELRSSIVRLCHLPGAGTFNVIGKRKWSPVQIEHHGLCNLSGDCNVTISKKNASTSPHERLKQMEEVEQQPTIFCVTHWKAGSQWINKILKSCVPEMIVPPEVDEVQFRKNEIKPSKVYTAVYLTREKFDAVELPIPWRRFIVIRDLRDTLISAYYSLKISHPVLDFRIEKWRKDLNNLSTDDGLIYLMEKWLPYCSNIQWSWLLSGETITRYEDLLVNDEEMLHQILIEDCCLRVTKDKLREAILANRFESLTKGRQRGQEDVAAHARKGIAGDWKNHFNDKVKDAFKTFYGDLLIASKYENDFNW